MIRSKVGQDLSLQGGIVVPEGVSFDGSADYLSRSTDLVGNVDSKTFTFSCWVYNGLNPASIYPYILSFNNDRVLFKLQADNSFEFEGFNSASSFTLSCTNNKIAVNGWTHVLASVDLTNPANRSVYVNDVLSSSTWGVYNNSALDFTQTSITVGSLNTTPRLKGRLSNLFLDYTYRDLSIEANRRLFITADGKPAEGQKSLSPIIGMSMKDKATAHINDFGYGGDFIQNGLIETADRGANQQNGVKSKIDGINYLTHTNETGATLSYWTENNGISEHVYSTGSVNIGDLTNALGDAIGEVYLTTATIAESEFITSDGLCIPARSVIENTGDSPKIAAPCSADNPIKNYGTAGDYVLVGGGLEGKRGDSEEISRSIVVDGTNYLTGSIFCKSLVKWLSLDGGVTWSVTYANDVTVTNIGNGTDNGVVAYYLGFSDTIDWVQEANKNMVTSQLGYPRAFTDAVKDSGWTPVLGLGFKDTTNFGLNDYGTDFVETGTIVASADVTV